MNVMSGSLVIVNLGMDTVKYLWKGKEIAGVVGCFVYKNTSLTIKVTDKNAVPYNEIKDAGIKVKVVKV